MTLPDAGVVKRSRRIANPRYRAIELMRTATRFFVNGKRVSGRKYELYGLASKRTDCFLTVKKRGVYHHYKTVRI